MPTSSNFSHVASVTSSFSASAVQPPNVSTHGLPPPSGLQIPSTSLVDQRRLHFPSLFSGWPSTVFPPAFSTGMPTVPAVRSPWVGGLQSSSCNSTVVNASSVNCASDCQKALFTIGQSSPPSGATKRKRVSAQFPNPAAR